MISIKPALIDYFTDLLRLPREKILTDINILDLGADSIMLIEAQRHVESRFGLRIELPQFFEDLNTIDKIAARIDAGGETANEKAIEAPVQGMPLVKAQASRLAALPPRQAPSAAVDPSLLSLLGSQLALVAETIEGQNRVLMSKGRPAIRQDRTESARLDVR